MGQGSYENAGVTGQGEALSAVARWLGPTFGFPEGAEVLTRFGHYASVLQLSDELAIAICTDGVGSKTIIASMLDRYDTIGFDCIAMNVNDIICVGARPLALVDYLGVHTLDARRTDDILRGLGDAAKEASIAIPGGEVAQLPDVIGSDGRSAGDERAFDLVGTCIGVLRPEELLLGAAIEPGDAIIGIASSGIHSNGFSLARRVLLRERGHDLTEHVDAFGCTLGEELLRPTEIYVRAVRDLWDAGIATHGLAHITGDGVVNLCRLEAEAGYALESWPEIPVVFRMIQDEGQIDDAEMFRVFNMGVGFVVIVPSASATMTIERLESSGQRAFRLGKVTPEAGTVTLEPFGLRGSLREGESKLRRL